MHCSGSDILTRFSWDPGLVGREQRDGLNPVDGSRLWLVDWEAAFQNERYADLSVVANMLAANVGEEQIYLQEYFGAPPDSYQVARFYLMKHLAQ